MRVEKRGLIDIWAACAAQVHLEPIAGEAIRVVESQEQIATNALVDDLAEQAQLEALLDAAKPPAPAGTGHLHYLLATPFRYPPLRHGSRFGTRNEPSLFYASLQLRTALAETAYYRLVFWSGMATPPPSGKLVTAHTVFGASYGTEHGLRLQHQPFTEFRSQIANPERYSDSQLLGRHMRATGVEAFEYPSARDTEGGTNIAMFSPNALQRTRPTFQQAWLCDTDAARVMFYSAEESSYVYAREAFLVDGELPQPAL